jgi:tetrahydromethanopterin S-methyltransferase subunit B
MNIPPPILGPTGYSGHLGVTGYTGPVHGEYSNFRYISHMDENSDNNIPEYLDLYSQKLSYEKDLVSKFKNTDRIKQLSQQVEDLTNEMDALKREVEKKKLGIEIIRSSIIIEQDQFLMDFPFPKMEQIKELEDKILVNYENIRTSIPPVDPTYPPLKTTPIKNKIKELWQKMMK